MQTQFNFVDEPTVPGLKWQTLFKRHWPTYKKWLESKEFMSISTLESSIGALKRYMPEMLPSYEKFCSLVGDNPMAQRFLTGFQPPVYPSGCSQLVLSAVNPTLIRNYDYYPNLVEGTVLKSAWNGKKVMAVGDSLIGILDGMNEDGLVVSHTFGGRKAVGKGFGIPFIARYILEFCSNVNEAVEVLSRIPSHMSYNVTVVDKSGVYKTVQMIPNDSPVITESPYTTNHQNIIDWPENARFNQTIERASFLEHIITDKAMSADSCLQAFLQPPLYNTKFSQGFGTIYTSVYKPTENLMEMYWPYRKVEHTFDTFKDKVEVVEYVEPVGQLK